MAIGVHLKKSLIGKHRVSAERVKETGDGLRSFDRTKRGSRESERGRSRKNGTDDIDSDVPEKRRGNLHLQPDQLRKKRAEKGSKVKPFVMGERYSRKDEAFARKGRVSDVGLSGRKPSWGKRRDFDGDDSGKRKGSNGDGHVLRGHRRKRDDRTVFYEDDFDERTSEGEGHRGKRDNNGGRKVSYRRENRRVSVEATDDKPRSKGKKMDGRGDAEVKLLEKNAESKDHSDQTANQKHITRLTRVLDKTGKKIKVLQKRSDDGTVLTEAPLPKKKKRTIKIDPCDISNKRLDDSVYKSEKAVEKDTEISKNAQFRAIQPSPSILSFVEDNLLGRRRLIELQNAGYNNKLSAPLDNIPFSTSTERARIEENVFRNKLEFFAAAKISSSFPPPIIPEIAFAGRSNVGKSSLLNALTRQWGVVRTSDTPGYTQSINYFKLASKLCLVDLPGYGFAYAKEEVKDAWEELVKEYVSTRVGLQRVCLLIDTKWGMKPRDHELIDLMERSQTPYQIVLTKTDVVFPIDVARRAMQIQENLKRNKSIVNPVMMVSSKSGAGIRSLRTVLAKLVHFVKP